jgi:hypothetical protein
METVSPYKGKRPISTGYHGYSHNIRAMAEGELRRALIICGENKMEGKDIL